MTNSQRWAIIVLLFVLLLVTILGGYSYNSIKSIERILSSPAATSEIDLDVDMMLEMSEGGEFQLKYIHLNRVQGKVNSKILDLILLAIND